MGSSNCDYVNAISEWIPKRFSCLRMIFIRNFSSINLLPLLRPFYHIPNTHTQSRTYTFASHHSPVCLSHVCFGAFSPPSRTLDFDIIHANKKKMKRTNKKSEKKSWWKLWYKWENLSESWVFRLKWWQTSAFCYCGLF